MNFENMRSALHAHIFLHINAHRCQSKQFVRQTQVTTAQLSNTFDRLQ